MLVMFDANTGDGKNTEVKRIWEKRMEISTQAN